MAMRRFVPQRYADNSVPDDPRMKRIRRVLTPEQRQRATTQQRERRTKDFSAMAKHEAYMAAYRANNRERILKTAMQSHYRRKFGLTVEARDAMLAAQGGRCAICETTTPKSRKGFGVDHDKQTNRIRAILCTPCNTGIGHLQHDPRILRAAATYMERHNAYQE